MNFKDLHAQDQPLIIANVWDVPSARLAEELNFQAIGTSSSSMATLLGYQDGEEMTFPELEYMVGRIMANTDLPLSVDLEAGYSRKPSEIVNHIKRLIDLGVVGINIEDSLVDGDRKLVKVEEFAGMLYDVTNSLNNDRRDIFINVRTDAFLMGLSNAMEETKKRVELYDKAGASGIFVPCVVRDEDIAAIVDCTTLPLNVMCMPHLSDFKKLAQLGVKRISMGNFIFDYMYDQCRSKTKEILVQQSFKYLF